MQIDGTAHGIHDTGELDQRAVAGGFDDASVVALDGGIGKFAAVRLEGRQSALFVQADKPRIADHVSREDSCETALDTGIGHGVHPTFEKARNQGHSALPINRLGSDPAVENRAQIRASEAGINARAGKCF
ncbi:MAG TPA: hypothetical protein VFZ07_00310 [Dongiaceae bacterium]